MPLTCVINDFTAEEIVGTFYEKDSAKNKIKKKLELKK